MKRAIIALSIAMSLVAGLCLPVFGSGSADADAQVGTMTLVGTPIVNNTVVFNVVVTAEADATANCPPMQWGVAYANTSVSVDVTDPNGTTTTPFSVSDPDVDLGSNPPGPANDPAVANAGGIYVISAPIYLGTFGTWTVDVSALAEAGWGTFFFIFPTGGGFDFDVATGQIVFEATLDGHWQYYEDWTEIIYLDHPTDPWISNSWWWMAEGQQYRLLIPEGTEVSGIDNHRETYTPDCFAITICQGWVTIGPTNCTLSFSNICELQRLEGGRWVTILRFNAVMPDTDPTKSPDGGIPVLQ